MHALAQTLPAELKLLVFKAAAEDAVLFEKSWVASLRLVCRTADVDIAPILYRSMELSAKNYSAVRELALAEEDAPSSRHVLSRVKHLYLSPSLEYVDFDAALLAAAFTGVTDVAGSEPIIAALAYHAPHRFPLPDLNLFVSPRFTFFPSESDPTAIYSRTHLVVTLADLPSAETTEDALRATLGDAGLVTRVAISVLGYAQTQGVPECLDAALRVVRECSCVLCIVVDLRPESDSGALAVERFLAALRDPRIRLRWDARSGSGCADPIRDCLEGRNVWREARPVCDRVTL